MKLLLTGCRGQLGRELSHYAVHRGIELIATDKSILDIADAKAVAAAVERHTPDAIINAAAWTGADEAESQRSLAERVNIEGPRILAENAESAGIPLVHFSTDYVFDGTKPGPYLEADPARPISVYGETKLAGELAVRDNCSRHLILRTSWVFSSHGHNFVKTMLRAGQQKKVLTIVDDQKGRPTSAAELARITFAALESDQESWGTYHVAQPDAVSWHEFAGEILRQADLAGLPMQVEEIRGIPTSEFPTAARRPANSELDCTLIESVFGVKIQEWRGSLTSVIKELKDDGFFA